MNFSVTTVIILVCLTGGLYSDEQPEPGSIRKACSKRGFIPPPPGRVDTTDRLRLLREHMKRENSVEGEPVDAYFITSDDEHQSEIVSEHDRRRQYISGFSGSSGDAIVTQDKAALWTDGRYHLQADDELNCKWLLMKHGRPDTPTQGEWLKHNLKPGARIGADAKLISNSVWSSLKYELENTSIQLVAVRKNLVDLIWTENRPRPSKKWIYVWDVKYAGKTWIEKVEIVRQELSYIGADAMVVTALDEIAWLLNIRGRDIPYNPFVTSYVLLSQDEIHFYVDKHKLTTQVEHHLNLRYQSIVNPNYVVFHDYDQIWIDLPTMAQAWKYVLLPSAWVYNQGVSQAIYSSVPDDKRLSKPSPIMLLKAQKNLVEIAGMERAAVRDSAALIEFLSDFESQFIRGDYWDELRVAKEVNQYRYSKDYGRGDSFETIVAFGANGAKPHYESSNFTNVPINTTSTLVFDSGGQYLDGTTDVTRTLHFGTPTAEQRFAYTKVLMGSIELSSLVFPANLKISAADVVARAPLWQSGMDYMHGTGHGVGAFLSVHESPISVAYDSPQKQQLFKVGYFFSNEPGYYKEGDFGIRLENVLEVIQKYPRLRHHSGAIYLGFKDITLVPYEPKLIDYSLLTIYQKRWLNDYNSRIRSFVGAELKRKRRMPAFYWMMEKTRDIPEYGSHATALSNMPLLYLITILIIYISSKYHTF